MKENIVSKTTKADKYKEHLRHERHIGSKGFRVLTACKDNETETLG